MLHTQDEFDSTLAEIRRLTFRENDMKIAPIAINSFARWLIGGVAFESAKTIVTTLEDTELTGEQKRAEAVATLKKFGYALAGFLVNLAIELAVAWLKSKKT